MGKVTFKVYRSISLSALIFTAIGCGKGFQADISLPSQTDLAVKGSVLYQQNCSACHGDIQNSDRAGSSATQIANAIATVPDMAHLARLSPADIESIAIALELDRNEDGDIMVYKCEQPATRGTTSKALRRLTKLEIQNSLRYLFGDAAYAQAEDHLKQIPDDIVENDFEKEFVELHKSYHANALMDFGEEVANFAIDGTQSSARNTLKNIAGDCALQANLTESCVENFIARFGRRVIRRPLSSAEESAYKVAYSSAPSQKEGLKVIIMALIQHPNFLFHLEEGEENGVEGARRKLTPYETASRISFQLTGATPDEILLEAAATGNLGTIEQVRVQAQRLLRKSAAQDHLENFLAYWLLFSKFGTPHAESLAMAGIQIDPENLRGELIQEFKDFATHIVFDEKGSFEDLMTSRQAFARSSAAASLVGAAVWDGISEPPMSMTHAGLAMRPALLVSGTTETRPVIRGLVLRTRVLCDAMNSPNNDAVEDRLEQIGQLSPLDYSMRERLSILTSPPECTACHSQINPLAFPLEAFDQLGRFRNVERVFDEDGQEVASHPLDLVVSRPNITSAGPDSLSGPYELAAALSESYKSTACMAQHFYKFSRYAEIKEADHCALRGMEEAIKKPDAPILDLLVESVANEDIFWKGI